jgi:hypothetical protein
MRARRLLVCVRGAALAAQAPISETDMHIAAAKAAAGVDYRATFVNLCLAGATPGLANPAVARAGGPWRCRRSRPARP